MNNTYFTRNFWFMTSAFVIIVLIAMAGLFFLMRQADFPVAEAVSGSR